MGTGSCEPVRFGGYQIGDIMKVNVRTKTEWVQDLLPYLDALTGGRWEWIGTGGGCEALECAAIVNGVVGHVYLTDGMAGVDFFHPETFYASLHFVEGDWTADCDWVNVDLDGCFTVQSLAIRVNRLLSRPDGSVIAQCFAGVI